MSFRRAGQKGPCPALSKLILMSFPATNLRELEALREMAQRLEEYARGLQAQCERVRQLPQPPMTSAEVMQALGLSREVFYSRVRAGKLRPILALNDEGGGNFRFPRHVIEAIARGEKVEWPAGCLPAHEQPGA